MLKANDEIRAGTMVGQGPYPTLSDPKCKTELLCAARTSCLEECLKANTTLFGQYTALQLYAVIEH